MLDIEKIMQRLSVTGYSKTFQAGLNPVFTVMRRQVKCPVTLLGTTPTK